MGRGGEVLEARGGGSFLVFALSIDTLVPWRRHHHCKDRLGVLLFWVSASFALPCGSHTTRIANRSQKFIPPFFLPHSPRHALQLSALRRPQARDTSRSKSHCRHPYNGQRRHAHQAQPTRQRRRWGGQCAMHQGRRPSLLC